MTDKSVAAEYTDELDDEDTPLAQFTIDKEDNEAQFIDANGEELWLQFDHRQDMLVFSYESEPKMYVSVFIEREIFDHAMERLRSNSRSR